MKLGLTFNVRLPSDQESRTHPHDSGPSANLDGYLAALDDRHEEFDSPETIQALAETLEQLGHEVELLGDGPLLVERLMAGPRPELVVNIAEGTGCARSREARVPAVLEMLSIPYTGSDPLTLAATLDKDCAKRLVASAGVATPAWAVYSGDVQRFQAQASKLTYPVIIKPAYEGSSKGVLETSVIDSPAGLEDPLVHMHEFYQQPILVEEYIEGDELTVGVLGNRSPQVLGVMRVLPQKPGGAFIYSLEVKRNWEQAVRYECPAALRGADTKAVEAAALACFEVLGCRDVARVDFRLRNGVPYFLEVNPLPGLSPKSGDLVLLAGYMGVGYQELVSRILEAACDRLQLGPASPTIAPLTRSASKGDVSLARASG